MRLINATLPTTDLYFLNSCGDLVAQYPWQKRPIKRLGCNTFQAGNRVLIIRNDLDRVLQKVLAEPQTDLLYLIDDNIWGGGHDISISEQYRKKLFQLQSGLISEIIEKASRVIISSDSLASEIPRKEKVHQLSPCWHKVPTNDHHFDQVNEIQLVHLGTNSHAAGFTFLKPVLAEVYTRYANVTFNYYSNQPLLDELDAHPQVKRRPLKRWSRYKREIGSDRFHLGLYPVAFTPLNNHRSRNKILEYALTGCAAVYSNHWPHSQNIEHGKNGWICPMHHQTWVDTICELLDNPESLRKSYQQASILFHHLNDLRQQRAFWMNTLLGD